VGGPALAGLLERDALIVLGGAVIWSVGTIAVARGVRRRAEPLALAAWQMLVGGLALIGFGVIAGAPPSADAGALGLALATGVIGGAVPLALFYLALARGPAGEVSAWFFLVPVVGVVSAWLLLGETPGPSLMAGLVTICAGLWLVMAHRSAGDGGLVESAPPP